MMPVHASAFGAIALVLALPAIAAGQASSPFPNRDAIATAVGHTTSVSSQEKPSGSTFTAGWRDGFFIQNENGDFRLQIGLLLNVDGRFAFDDSTQAITDTFLIRRARPYLRGRIARYFEFYVNPDFAGGTLVLQDAYVDTRFTNAFRVRIGKAKAPFGHERLQSVANILFLERGAPTAVAPNRDLGIQVLGDAGIFSYQAGVMNGAPDGGSVDLDSNDGKDLLGRVAARPFMKRLKSPLAGLGFALSGSWGKQSGPLALPIVRTSILQQIFLSYVGAAADGTRTRYSPFVVYYNKAFAGWFEYARSEMPIRRGTVVADIAQRGWQVVGSYVLTGEAASESGVRPKNNFDFGNGHWGAWQIAARYHAFSADEAAITLGLATPGSSHEAKAWTVGFNWYLNPFIKYVVDFERTVFDGDTHGPRPPENGLAFRMQLAF
jgi:phosphate-selective porin OprO/OprP